MRPLAIRRCTVCWRKQVITIPFASRPTRSWSAKSGIFSPVLWDGHCAGPGCFVTASNTRRNLGISRVGWWPRLSGADRVRHWKLDRFRKAEALDEYFTVPPEFDLDQHLGQSIGIFSGGKPRKFRIRVSAYAARWVTEDPWHPDQDVVNHKDGSATLTVRAAHELEIIPRVLALGAEAEVLSPKSCRQALSVTLKKMAQMYGD